MNTKPTNMKQNNNEIDLLAVEALESDHAFEIIFTKFTPYLMGRVSKWASHSSSMHDEIKSEAMQAFHEAIHSFDPSKGHFFPLMKIIVHKRIVDCYRRLTTNQVETVPFEANLGEYISSNAIDRASLKAHQEAVQYHELVLELEEFKQELLKWNITMEILAKNSPKQARTRNRYREIVKLVVTNAEILHIVKSMHYFPVKMIQKITKSPLKLIERARIYIIACLIIHMGDYEYLQEHIDLC